MEDEFFSKLPLPMHTIQHRRYLEQDGWQLDDISLCSSGSIAVSGCIYGVHRSYICIYSSAENSDAKSKSSLLYDKRFTDKNNWPGRYISFAKPCCAEIVTCRGDEVTVVDYNRDEVLQSRKVNGIARCLSVNESQILIGFAWSDTVNIYNNNLIMVKSIQLKLIRKDYAENYPVDISAAENSFYVCPYWENRVIKYWQDQGDIKANIATTRRQSTAWAVTMNNIVAAVLWQSCNAQTKQITFSYLHNYESFLTVNVKNGVCRIRISDQCRLVTGDAGTDEVKIYDLVNYLVTYDTLKNNWVTTLQEDDCRKLINYFALSEWEMDNYLLIFESTKDLLLALEERGIIYPSNVSRLIDAFVALQMSENYYREANTYQEIATSTCFERFLVTLSAHLTKALVGNLCSDFNIPSNKRDSITSSKTPGLTLLLTLNEMDVINQSKVHALEEPFSKLRLVQAVAKIQEYKSVLEGEKDLLASHRNGEKRNLFLKLLQRKIMSWYEAMTPVPWKKSCQWKSSELFVERDMILTNCTTQKPVNDVDEQSKLKYSEIFSHESLKEETRIIIKGEPGSGKTMLSSQFAYEWSQGKISDINMFILLPLKFVEMKTLVEATKEFYFMEDYGLSLVDIDDVITGEGGKCCFLLDGLEEYKGQGDTSAEELSEVMKIMTKVKYPSCKVILTSSSDYVQELPSCPVLQLGQFGKVQRYSYIEKVFSDSKKQMEVKEVIDKTPLIVDFCSVPLLFLLAVHNIEVIKEQQIHQTRVSHFIGKMVETLCPLVQKEDKVRQSERREYIRIRGERKEEIYYRCDVLDRDSRGISLEKLAFNGLCRRKQLISWQMGFVEENVRNMKQYLDSGILVVEETFDGDKAVMRAVPKNFSTEKFEGVWSKLTQETSGPWNIPASGASHSGRAVPAKRKHLEETLQEPQEGRVYIASKGKEISDEYEGKEHRAISSNTESIVQGQSQPEEQLVSPFRLRYVSLRVRFLHKVIQEWFAARYLTAVCLQKDTRSWDDLFFIKHLQRIKPAEFCYVLPFTCALCPSSCHLIVKYLLSAFRSEKENNPEYIINCICLCLAEYDGCKDRYIKDVISEVCKSDITIHYEDSRLLQWAKVSMLNLASDCGLPITGLQLVEVIVGASEDELILNYGATLKVMNTVQKIKIIQWDHSLKEKDCISLIRYVTNIASVEKALFIFPRKPPLLQYETLKEKASKQVSVEWRTGETVWTLDLSKGKWMIVEEETGLSDVAQTQLSVATPETQPLWEEEKVISYHVEDTNCIIYLNSFSRYTYSVDDGQVIAKKLVVYAAAEKLESHDAAARIEVGCYPDLPGEDKKIELGSHLLVAHQKIIYFVKRKEQYPLRISLNDIFPSGWGCRCKCEFPETHSQEIPYSKISANLRGSCVYILEKTGNVSGRPLCVFTVSQTEGNTAVQVAVNFQVLDKKSSTPGIMGNQCTSSLKAESNITKSGGELEIKGTGVDQERGTSVVLKIPPNAVKGNAENQLVHMRIISNRVTEDQETSLSSTSCTAIEIFPHKSLNKPVELRLPHCLMFNETSDLSARIFINDGKGRPAIWREVQNVQHSLDEKECVITFNKLCGVKYLIDDGVVRGKKIKVYTAAKEVELKNEVAEIEVGYYTDIPGSGELLRMNPSFIVGSEETLLFMKEQKPPLQLNLDDISSSQWTCWFPKDRQLDISFEVVASSIEHSQLFILQNTSRGAGIVFCRFIALQKGDSLATTLAQTLRPKQEEDQLQFAAQNQERQATADHMTTIFQNLSKNIGSEWLDIGRNLGLADAELNHIQSDYPSRRQEAIYQMLLYWKQTRGSNARYYVLIKALETTDRKDLAENV